MAKVGVEERGLSSNSSHATPTKETLAPTRLQVATATAAGTSSSTTQQPTPTPTITTTIEEMAAELWLEPSDVLETVGGLGLVHRMEGGKLRLLVPPALAAALLQRPPKLPFTDECIVSRRLFVK